MQVVLAAALLQSGCGGGGGMVPAQQGTTNASPPGTAVNSLQGMEPARPFDETPITPYETVGASMMN